MQDACRIEDGPELVAPLLLMELAIVARRLLRQGRRLVVWQSWRGSCFGRPEPVVLLLVELAIVARRLLRQGRWRAFPLALGGEAPPGTPGV